jgi:hypothetical protein
MAIVEPTTADIKDDGNPIPETEREVKVHQVVGQSILE